MILPAIPALLAFCNKIISSPADGIPDYTLTATFDNSADRNLLGSVYTHPDWTQPQRNTLMLPGMLYLLETDRSTDASFRTYGARLGLPNPTAATDLATIENYLCLSTSNQWFGHLITIMQQYCTYFKGTVTLGQCDDPNNVSPLLRTKYVTPSSPTPETNVYTTLTHAFPEHPPFLFDASHYTVERIMQPAACAVAQAAKINVSIPGINLARWNQIGVLTQTLTGDYWMIRPITSSTKVESTWKTTGSSISQHYALVKPTQK